MIVSRLFKEGDFSDAEELSASLSIPFENIVNIYKNSPFFNQNGFEHWQNDFGLVVQSQKTDYLKPKRSAYLDVFFQNRGIHV